MTQTKHKSVLVNEVLEYLDPQPGKVYLDATFGAGGHTRAILEKQPECTVVALDWDERAFELFGQDLLDQFPDRLQFIWGNFSLLHRLLKREGVGKVDGILADFGTSQIQIHDRPGFSVFKETALDMRMSPPHQKESAADVVNNASERTLADLFFAYGQERWSREVARAIVEERKRKPIKTTADLVAIVDRAIPVRGKIHKATRIFQALRIYINKELANIQAFLPAACQALNPQGRLVCISFHSLEDRLVKQFFKQEEEKGVLQILTPKIVIPTDLEIKQNASARSARLRAAQKIG